MPIFVNSTLTKYPCENKNSESNTSAFFTVPPVRQRRVFVLSGSDIPAERKRRNIRSYNELLQKLELKSTTNKSIATTSNHIIKKSIPVQDSSLRESPMRSLPRPVLCRSPVMPEPATKPVFTGVRARFSSLSKYTGGNKSTEACGSVRVQLNESEHRHDTGEPDVTARDCRLRPVNDLAHKRLSRHSFPSLRSRTLRRWRNQAANKLEHHIWKKEFPSSVSVRGCFTSLLSNFWYCVPQDLNTKSHYDMRVS